MTLNPTIDLIAVISSLLGILGGYYLVRSIVQGGTKEIVGMASTFFGDNPILIDALSTQKADSTIGFGLATLSGIFWLASSFVALNTDNYRIATILILTFFVVCIPLCNLCIGRLRKSIFESATLLSFANHANSYMQTWNEMDLDPTKLIADAKRMGLNYLLNETASDLENLLFLLHRSGNEEIIANFDRALKLLKLKI